MMSKNISSSKQIHIVDKNETKNGTGNANNTTSHILNASEKQPNLEKHRKKFKP